MWVSFGRGSSPLYARGPTGWADHRPSCGEVDRNCCCVPLSDRPSSGFERVAAPVLTGDSFLGDGPSAANRLLGACSVELLRLDLGLAEDPAPVHVVSVAVGG